MTERKLPVFRLAKIKTSTATKSMGRHWNRTQPTPNADTSMPGGVQVLCGTGNPDQDMQPFLDRITGPRRKDEVIGIEALMSASEDMFRRPDQPEGSRDPERVKAWSDAAMKCLREQFPDMVASAVLHLDETTPHIHALIVPVVEKERKARGRGAKDKPPILSTVLDAKSVFGGMDTLSGYQDAYEASMKPLGGRERTRKDITAATQTTHKEIRDFYSGMRQATKEIEASKKRQQEEEEKSILLREATEEFSRDIKADSLEFAQRSIEEIRKNKIESDEYKKFAIDTLKQAKKEAIEIKANAEKEAEEFKRINMFDTDMIILASGVLMKEIKPVLKDGIKTWANYSEKPIEPKRLEEYKKSLNNDKKSYKAWDYCKELFDRVHRKMFSQKDQNMK